ncbi:DUF6286 domain-containing protein [Streptomyces sp. NPDC002851]
MTEHSPDRPPDRPPDGEPGGTPYRRPPQPGGEGGGGPSRRPTQRLPVIERTATAELGQSASAAAYTPVLTPEEGGSHRRRWSARRIPAVIAALVLLGGAGLLLYDVAAVRAGRPPMAWRRILGRELAARPLDDLWVLIGAGGAIVVGLWLLVLATTPGHRALRALRAADPDVQAWLNNDAAALVLRDRAMEVAGVQSVRVRVTRSAVDVRAVSHFRELDDVRADLDDALGDGIASLGLARAPGLSVRVHRPGTYEKSSKSNKSGKSSKSGKEA